MRKKPEDLRKTKTKKDKYHRRQLSSGDHENTHSEAKKSQPAKQKTKKEHANSNSTQPTPTFIYGNKIVLISWKPTPRFIFIESTELSDAFRKHFEGLWSLGREE